MSKLLSGHNWQHLGQGVYGIPHYLPDEGGNLHLHTVVQWVALHPCPYAGTTVQDLLQIVSDHLRNQDPDGNAQAIDHLQAALLELSRR